MKLELNMSVIDNNTENMIRLTTDDKNPRVPQVVMIDSEVMGIIYGGNEVKETDIECLYMRDDNVITVTLDRVKGKHTLKLQDKLHSGVYFVHVSVNNQTAKSKMVILQ